MNLVYGLALHEFSVSQRIERPPGVLVRILSGSQIFPLSHARDMLIISFSHWISVLWAGVGTVIVQTSSIIENFLSVSLIKL